MNITLKNLHWINYIESIQINDKDRSSLQSKWRIFSRFKMLENGIQQFKFSGGEKPNELIFELNLMSAHRNSNEIKKHRLENSAGALIYLGDKYSNDFIISGIIVLNDEVYDEVILSTRFSTSVYSQLILSLNGLEPPKSGKTIPIWNNVKNKKLEIAHVQTTFHYGHPDLPNYSTRSHLGAWLKSL
ncbi:hypothetical protein [Nitrosomonas supralitoralis]|uniref:Uncharacterized protein n=1 Tax=Nitrosomonas supralitoralis TaxID=2116706 RepID=A0A2P7NTS3_9PROT|nr:hypothetical protein [Nitrosomonas supralitoralis]PSJ16872.1 hypothetical protein C7H79_10940 [Nitrosomonas supralitoralis]